MGMEGLSFKRWGVVNYGAYDMNTDYSIVGFDLCQSGGQGGEFIAPWEVQEEYHKHCIGFVSNSFHCFFYGGGEGGLMILVQVVRLNAAIQ